MTLSRHHIAAGGFWVGPKQPKILQAFSGTCVGVAIHDRQADVVKSILDADPEMATGE